MKVVGWIIAAALGVLTLLAVAGFAIQASPEGKQRIAQREAIEQCRAYQNDELETIATRRAMRDICDGLTRRFREKWNREP